MIAWDIWTWTPPGFPEPHPAVIISHPDRVARKPVVCVLACSSHRAGRDAAASEVILDQADGLDWPTICYCDVFYQLKKADLMQKRGHVTDERRRQIITTIIRSNGWV